MTDDVLSPNWSALVEGWMQQGIAPYHIHADMRRHGFGLGMIRKAMGEAAPLDVPVDADGRDVSQRSAAYAAIAGCALTRQASPDLRRVDEDRAQIYLWDNFLQRETCERLMALTEGRLQPSRNSLNDPILRTSQTCAIETVADPVVQDLDRRIASALGLSPRWSEPNQLQKYRPGERFGTHADYFEPGSMQYAREAHVDGQRTWTFMIYLNAPEAGGETRFNRLGRTFRPRAGSALIWNNLTAEGDPNRWTEHEGAAVEAGEKYIVTKWYRDKGEGPLFMENAHVA